MVVYYYWEGVTLGVTDCIYLAEVVPIWLFKSEDILLIIGDVETAD